MSNSNQIGSARLQFYHGRQAEIIFANAKVSFALEISSAAAGLQSSATEAGADMAEPYSTELCQLWSYCCCWDQILSPELVELLGIVGSDILSSLAVIATILFAASAPVSDLSSFTLTEDFSYYISPPAIFS